LNFALICFGWNEVKLHYVVRFMKDVWNETLRCPTCLKTGVASLSQDNGNTPIIQLVPDGFKVVDTEHGPDFRCADCDVAVKL